MGEGITRRHFHHFLAAGAATTIPFVDFRRELTQDFH